MTTTDASPRSSTMAVALAGATLAVVLLDALVGLAATAGPVGASSSPLFHPGSTGHALLLLGLVAAFAGLGATALRSAPPRNAGAAADRHRIAMATALREAWIPGLVALLLATLLADRLATPNLWRGSEFYVAAAIALPFPLIWARWRTAHRWGATLVAAIYTLTHACALVLEGALAPWLAGAAEPPWRLPLLALAPALVLDAAWPRLAARPGSAATLLRAPALGLLFLLPTLAAHWWGAPLVLAGDGGELASWTEQYWNLDPGTRAFARGIGLAWVVATAGAALGSLGRRRPPDAHSASVGRRTFL